jgi:cell division protein FtsL
MTRNNRDSTNLSGESLSITTGSQLSNSAEVDPDIRDQTQKALTAVLGIAEGLKAQQNKLNRMDGLIYFGFVVIVLMTGAIVIAYIQQINQTNDKIYETLNQTIQSVNRLEAIREQSSNQGQVVPRQQSQAE